MRQAYAHFERRAGGALVSELLPTRPGAAASGTSLVDYLTTTFALADDGRARRARPSSSSDPDDGHVQGPVRAAAAAVPPGRRGLARRALEWYEGLPAVRAPGRGVRAADSSTSAPTAAAAADAGHHRHRLGQDRGVPLPDPRPLLRARREGVTGTKALILYPMNALANDQAQRLAELITDARRRCAASPRRSTPGRQGPQRTMVTADGLITDRGDHPATARRHPAHQLQDARPAAAARTRTQDIWRQTRDEPAVPRARRVPHLRRRAGHRRRDAAAPARPGAQEPLARRRPAITDEDRARRSAGSPRSPPRRRWATRATRRRCSTSPRPCSASRSTTTPCHRVPAERRRVGRRAAARSPRRAARRSRSPRLDVAERRRRPSRRSGRTRRRETLAARRARAPLRPAIADGRQPTPTCCSRWPGAPAGRSAGSRRADAAIASTTSPRRVLGRPRRRPRRDRRRPGLGAVLLARRRRAQPRPRRRRAGTRCRSRSTCGCAS